MSNPSRIIKVKEGHALPDGVAFHTQDYEEAGRRVIEAARAKAASILQEAHGILESARQTRDKMAQAREVIRVEIREAEKTKNAAKVEGIALGREEGRRLGVEEGRREGIELVRKEAYEEALEEARARLEKETEEALRVFDTVVKHVEEGRDSLVKGAHGDLFALAIRIAEVVVKREIRLDPAIVRNNVIHAIDHAMQASVLSILLHPTEVEIVEKYLGSLRERFARVKSFEVRGDERVAPGGCIVQSGGGEVDSRLEVQLEEIRRHLLEGI